MTMRQIATVLGLVFVIALAVVVGKQMNAEAMAVVVGVVCGVAAGIPTSVLVMVILSRLDRQRLEDTERQPGQHSYPPVVVIQGGASQGLTPGSQAGYWPAPLRGAAVDRQFHLVGGEDLLVEDEAF